jgi:hypothetical protein
VNCQAALKSRRLGPAEEAALAPRRVAGTGVLYSIG